MRVQTRPPGGDRPAITRIVAALVVGGTLTTAGIVRSSVALMIAGVVLLFICSTAARVWYFRRRR